ncbi:cell wall-active antibiotics response protein LiaF [Paenibacillus glucanolyticus]|uniref:cell wall-active antibiotics response protein LiaF n=2 Tax=Paenibacillus glucanolyticus TaxID=59843 RepID=UPI003CFCD9E9
MTMSRKGWSQLSSGLLLIGIGVLFLLNQLDLINVDLGYIFSTFWPVFLIWFGLQSLIYARGGALWGAVVPIIIGTYFLGRNLDLVDFSFGDLIKYAIPIILIGFGLQVIFKPRHHTPPPSPPSPDDFSSHRREDYDLPEPPEARPLDSSLDEEFERRFGKPDKADKADKTHSDPEPASMHDREPGKGYRWDGQQHERPRQEREDRSRFRVHVDFDNDGRSYGDGSDNTDHHHDQSWNGHDTVNKSSFIGDVHMGKDYFQLKPTNISQFIGDTVLDLTKAQIPYGETKINISAFIGDVKVFVPNDSDIGIHVTTNSFIGDMKVLEESRSGFMSNAGLESPHYREAGKKIRIIVSVFIGDVKVNRVG